MCNYYAYSSLYIYIGLILYNNILISSMYLEFNHLISCISSKHLLRHAHIQAGYRIYLLRHAYITTGCRSYAYLLTHIIIEVPCIRVNPFCFDFKDSYPISKATLLITASSSIF